MNREIASARRVFIFAYLRPGLASLEESLRKLGYNIVASARSGKDALEKIEATKPELVLMDFRLQGNVDGIDAAALVREKYDVPVVYLKDFDAIDSNEAAATVAPFDYIVTPFHEEELRTIIEIAIFKYRVEKRQAEENVYQHALEEFIRLFRLAQAGIGVREEFISTAAHELKTPLTTLQLLVDAIKARINDLGVQDEGLSTKLAAMEEHIEHSSALLCSVLDTSKISTGKFSLNFEEFDFVEMVRSVVESISPIAQRAGCTVDIQAGSPIIGRWDRLRMEQVLNNLLSNGIKFGAGKPVEVEIHLTNEGIQLLVGDHGMGMSANTMEKIFQRYERGSSSSAQAGLGLGMFIADEIVKAHGGSMQVQSTLGAGSVFTVHLPRYCGNGNQHLAAASLTREN
jgi:signal transduction histidine kinase